MKRFSAWGPWAYALAVEKNIAQRKLADAFSGETFAQTRQEVPLPFAVCRHNSLIRRTLGQVDPRLQDNKAVSLGLAAPRVNGVLIRPGETFSFWHLVGRCTRKKGYLPGMVLHDGQPAQGVGGGMCQFTNLIHWMVLHSDLTVTERHHHDGMDLFPDFGRQVPFGVGTSILYNYLDYRVKNQTEETFQLLTRSDGEYLRGELRCTRRAPCVAHHLRGRVFHPGGRGVVPVQSGVAAAGGPAHGGHAGAPAPSDLPRPGVLRPPVHRPQKGAISRTKRDCFQKKYR